jgi:hypothetical protein
MTGRDGVIIGRECRESAPQTKFVQGWLKLRDLAQHFDWKFLLEP